MIYHRPNLTTDERDLLASLVRQHFTDLDVDDPGFDRLYCVYAKLKNARPFNTSKTLSV